MNEQDERTIYEWVLGHKIPAGYRPPRPPDMNFAFDVCVPKLHDAEVSVTFTNFDDAGRWHLIDAKCGDTVETVDYEHADFYTALLAYIKGIQ